MLRSCERQIAEPTSAYVLDINAPGVFDNDFYPQDASHYDRLYGAYNGGRTSGVTATSVMRPPARTRRSMS